MNKTRILLLLIIWIISGRAHAVSPDAVRKNNEGVENFRQEKYYEAYQQFTGGLAEAPLDPYIQLNLGLTFQRNEEPEKAYRAFLAAEELARRSNNEPARFYAHVDAGTSSAEGGNVDKALNHFQEALEIRPDDELVKENIEKLWQAQQGGGKGGKQQQDKKQQNKDSEGQDEQEKQQPQQGQNQQEQKQQQPKPFDSKELTKDDVRKILEEIKNQEQKIRAEVYEGKAKDHPREKDW